ncbi:MAG: M48 family metallopeptidase [Vicinamibacteria bacterium]
MTRRLVTAVALYTGFYLVGACIIVGLLSLPWMQVRYGGDGDLYGFLAACGALYVAWAMVPRPAKWMTPGLELTRKAQPRLWTVLERIAKEAAYKLPEHVYLLNDVQAFASSRPRWFGLKREPVIGLGLPLFSFLSERELRAVVAHEMGHHVGGDVRLGPWLYRTSNAINAALTRLDGSNAFLNLPFYAYGRLYVRIAAPHSRQQEVHADELAARLAGGRFLGSALLAVEQHSILWNGFFYDVVVPTLNEGFRPGLLEGYERYVKAVDRDEHSKSFRKMVDRPADREDSHPPLRERLKPLSTPCEPHDPSATSAPALLSQLAQCERDLIALNLNKPETIDELLPLAWDEWGETVLPRIWRRTLDSRLRALQQVSLSSIPDALQDDGLWDRLRDGVNIFSAEARRQQSRLLIAYWFAWSLHEAGYRVISGPGDEPTLQRGESRIMPFRWLRDLESGKRTRAEWDVLCAEIGESAGLQQTPA